MIFKRTFYRHFQMKLGLLLHLLIILQESYGTSKLYIYFNLESTNYINICFHRINLIIFFFKGCSKDSDCSDHRPHCIAGICSGNEILSKIQYVLTKYNNLKITFPKYKKKTVIYLDCSRHNIYKSGTLHKENVGVLTAIQCLDECIKDDECKYWDMYEKNCRLFSGQIGRLESGYGGALAGTKSCLLRENGPKGIN